MAVLRYISTNVSEEIRIRYITAKENFKH